VELRITLIEHATAHIRKTARTTDFECESAGREQRNRKSRKREQLAWHSADNTPPSSGLARVLDELLEADVTEIKLLQEHLHEALGKIVYSRARRRPMILPVIVEV
jgi:3-dehydroquinate dehydratase